MTADATSEVIRRILTAAGHADLVDAAVALRQPAIAVTATALAPRPADWRSKHGETDTSEAAAAFDAAMAALPIGASRLGGLPDMASGAAWPELDGVPMEFLAQLRLDEVAPLDPLDRLPATGSLLFFKNSQFIHNDMDPDVKACVVMHAEGDPGALRRATPPRVEWKSEFSPVPQIAPFIHGLARVIFSTFHDLPPARNPHVAKALSPAWGALYVKHHDDLFPANALNHVLGYLGGDDYVGAHVHGTDDQLLFELSSDPAADFCFGDMDTLRFMVRRSELAARDFSRVRCYLNVG